MVGAGRSAEGGTREMVEGPEKLFRGGCSKQLPSCSRGNNSLVRGYLALVRLKMRGGDGEQNGMS